MADSNVGSFACDIKMHLSELGSFACDSSVCSAEALLCCETSSASSSLLLNVDQMLFISQTQPHISEMQSALVLNILLAGSPI